MFMPNETVALEVIFTTEAEVIKATQLTEEQK